MAPTSGARRHLGWSGAVTVTLVTVALVALDLSDRAVHQYWTQHSFTSSVLSGVLVLALTVLIIDRVTGMRQLKSQSRAIAAQAAVIVAQAQRTAEAVSRPTPSEEDRQEAADELRSYMQMLLVSAPLLIGADTPRSFLEAAQRFAGRLYRAVQAAEDGTVDPAALDAGATQVRQAAAPLLAALNLQERAAVSSDDA